MKKTNAPPLALFTPSQMALFFRPVSEALEKLRRMRNEAAAGMETEGGASSLEEYLTWWLETMAKRSVRHGTWVRYEQLVRLRIVPNLGRVRLDRLTPSLVEQFLTDLGKAGVTPRGQQMAVNVLGRALKDAVRLRRIGSNSVRDVVKPQVGRGKNDAYSLDEVARFNAVAVKDRLYALYILAIDTGMRSGELFALEWEDVNFSSGCIMVQRALKEVSGQFSVDGLKTEKSRRRIPLASLTLDVLHEHRKRQFAEGTAGKLVFCDTEGNHLRRPNVARRSFHPLLKQAGLRRIRFHDLRHTCISLLLQANLPTKVISERSGHSSTQVTEMIYQHVLPTMQEQAAEKMNALLAQALNRKPEEEASAG